MLPPCGVLFVSERGLIAVVLAAIVVWPWIGYGLYRLAEWVW